MSVRTRLLRSALTAVHATGTDRLFERLSGARGAILMLHHVREERRTGFAPNAHLSVSPDFLDDLLDMLRRRSVAVVAMDEVPERLAARSDERFAAITFDDGYRDNLYDAVPVLRAHRAPYAIYVTTGFVSGEAFPWWIALESLVRGAERLVVPVPDGSVVDLDCSDNAAKCETYERLIDFYKTEVPEHDVERHVRDLCLFYGLAESAIAPPLVMSVAELATLTGDPLCTLGAHTRTHRSLARLSSDEARREIREGRDEIERALGRAPRHLAYPYGFAAAAGPREFALARELGFLTAVTTRRGVLYDAHAEHLTALPRISLNGHYQRLRYADALISGLPTTLARGGRRLDVG